MVVKKSLSEKIFDVFNIILLSLITIICIYPFLYVIFASFSDPYRLMQHKGILFKPLGFTLNGYKLVFNNPSIMTGFLNTVFYVVVGTSINLILTSMSAYVLSRKNIFFISL